MSDRAADNRAIRDLSPLNLPLIERLRATIGAAKNLMALGLKLDNGDLWTSGYRLYVDASETIAKVQKQ